MAQYIVLRNFSRYMVQGQKSIKSYRIPKRLMSFTCLREKQAQCATKQFLGDEYKKANDKVADVTPAAESLSKSDNDVVNEKTTPECCNDPCKDAFPPFDLLYYKKSNQSSRQYQQTWVDCPEILKKPKVLCCYDKITPPLLPKRMPKDKPKTACSPPMPQVSLCPSFTSPSCLKGRKPSKCTLDKRSSLCKPKKPPYPSFSECGRKIMSRARPIECNCLGFVSMCEFWTYYHGMQRLKKPLTICQ